MIRAALGTVCGGETYEPPAPIVRGVRIWDLTGSVHPQVWDGLVDTAGDRTVIPLAVCRDLNLAARDKRSTKGFDRQAKASLLPRYYVRVGVEDIGEVSLLVYGVERPSVLLGRDFLSGLLLLMDAGRSQWWLGRPTCVTRCLLPFLALR